MFALFLSFPAAQFYSVLSTVMFTSSLGFLALQFFFDTFSSGTAHSICSSNMQSLSLSCLHGVFTCFVIKCSLPSSLLNWENNLANPKSGATMDCLLLLCLVAAPLFLPASVRQSCGGGGAGGFFSCLASFPFSFPRRDISLYALTTPRVGVLLPA